MFMIIMQRTEYFYLSWFLRYRDLNYENCTFSRQSVLLSTLVLPHNVKDCEKSLYSYLYLQMIITIETCTCQLITFVAIMRPNPSP